MLLLACFYLLLLGSRTDRCLQMKLPNFLGHYTLRM